MARVKIAEFGIIQKALAGASVAVYVADENGESTGALATLYQASTGAESRSNPQTLDDDGKLANDCYVDDTVVAAISNISVATERSIRKIRVNPLEYPLPVTSSGVNIADTAASASTATAQAAIATAKAVLTEADAIATAADRVQTGLDRIATAADRVQTGLDRIATAADRVQTGIDAAAAAAASGKVNVSANDTTPGDLEAKILVAGALSLSTQNEGGNETRTITVDLSYTVNAIGSVGGGTQDIDLSLGRSVSATVDTSTTTFTFSNPRATGNEDIFTLRLTNGGSQTVNWPPSVDWPGGVAPDLTAAGVDELVFKTIDGGTTWAGAAILDVS